MSWILEHDAAFDVRPALSPERSAVAVGPDFLNDSSSTISS